MRIIHIVRIPITVELFLLPLIRAQSSLGHDVAIACDADEDTTLLETCGISVHKYHLQKRLNLFNVCKAFWSLKQIITQSDFDLIIAHMPLAGAIARLAVKFSSCRAKVIYVAHGFPFAPRQPRLRWLFWLTVEWLLGRITDALFVMNDYDYNIARRSRILKKTENIRRISGMGVDLESFSPGIDDGFCAQQLGIEHSKMVLFVARMIREKGVFEFLKAAELLANKDCAFVLIGDGPVSKDVSKYIIEHRLTEKVFFLGWRDDVHKFMKRCDLFVLPTYYFEGLPVTILEAMASGKPVIATRHRGCEDEVVHGTTGYLIDIKNPKQLAEKIDVLLNDEALRVKMGQAGRDRVGQLFSLDKAVKTFCEAVSMVID